MYDATVLTKHLWVWGRVAFQDKLIYTDPGFMSYEEKHSIVDCWVCSLCGAIDLLAPRGQMPKMYNRVEGGDGIDAIARHIHNS